MWHLAKSELVRFRRPALALMLFHASILFVLTVSGDLLAFGEDLVLVGMTAYALTGLIAGLYHIGTWRRLHLWTYLVHRPLPPGRIFASLSGAMSLLLFAVVAAPLATAILAADLMAWHWVDGRSYLVSVYAYLMILAFYLIGCFIMLSASRAACFLLVLPFLFLTAEAPGGWIILLQTVVLLWTGYLACAAFQPDLSIHLRRFFAVFWLALPVQYVFFWAVHFALLAIYSTLVAFSEHGWKGYALHGWDDYFDEGTYARVSYMSPHQALTHGLQLADSARARQFLGPVEDAYVRGFRPVYTTPQFRGQLPFMDRARAWSHRGDQVVWTFSHDLMRFHGRDRLNGRSAGWLGVSGRPSTDPDTVPAFSEVPLFANHQHVVTKRRVYSISADKNRLEQRFMAASNERLLTQWKVYKRFSALLTDKKLCLFAPSIDSTPLAEIPWRGSVDNLSRVLVGQVDDGYLVSFILGRQSPRDFDEARQVVGWLDTDGDYEVLVDQKLLPGPPAWSRHRGFIASPVMQHVHDLVMAGTQPYRTHYISVRDVAASRPPASVMGAAVVLALISGALSAWSARRRRLEPARRWAWTAAGFVIGLPAFLSFYFLTPSREPTPESTNSLESETC